MPTPNSRLPSRVMRALPQAPASKPKLLDQVHRPSLASLPQVDDSGPADGQWRGSRPRRPRQLRPCGRHCCNL